MAKSRKSNKADQKANAAGETPQDAEKIVSKEEVDAAGVDDAKGSELDSKAPSEATDSDTKAVGDVAQEDTVASEAVDKDALVDQPDDADQADVEDISDQPADEEAGNKTSEDEDKVPEDIAATTADGDEKDTDKTDDQKGDGADAAAAMAPWGAVDTDLADTDKTVADETNAEDPEEPAKTDVDEKPAPQQEKEVVRGSIWPAFFGGVIAAMIGFIAGRGDMLDQFFPPEPQPPAIDLTAIEEAASAQSAALEEQISALEEQAVRLDALEALSGAVETVDLSGLESELQTLQDRIAALESRPVDTGPSVEPEDVSELQAALDAQKAEIDALAARAEAAESEAAGEAARLLAQAALMRVMTAVDSGEAFSPALQELENVAPVEVPDPLRTAAENGVPTVASLQEGFPDAARTALSATRAEVPESDVSGIAEFFKRQLNVRSVTPREGSDADAVLSRAQAALNGGDINTALTELEALSETGRAAMSDWLEAASARSAAQNAAEELADSLNSN